MTPCGDSRMQRLNYGMSSESQKTRTCGKHLTTGCTSQKFQSRNCVNSPYADECQKTQGVKTPPLNSGAHGHGNDEILIAMTVT
jgi:hypothetical protein